MDKIRNVLLAILFALFSTFQGGKDTTMTIETDGTGTKYIKWTQPAGVTGLTTRTFMMWVYPTNNSNPYEVFLIYDGTGTDADELSSFQLQNGKVALLAHWSTANGFWYATSTLVTLNTWNHIAVTYDGGSTANNPVIYVNGASVAVTRAVSPSGTYRTGTAADVYLGSDVAGQNLPGKVSSPVYYNRILSASEILDAYNSRLAIPTYRGLVFAPFLSGAKGLQNFDGATLSSSNLIVDSITGSAGVPTGSPVGRAETYVTVK